MGNYHKLVEDISDILNEGQSSFKVKVTLESYVNIYKDVLEEEGLPVNQQSAIKYAKSRVRDSDGDDYEGEIEQNINWNAIKVG